MYTGVIMPRIPAPPLIQGGSKYKIQYEFHVNVKHKIHYVLYSLYLRTRAGVNTIQCEFRVNIKHHWRSTPVMRTHLYGCTGGNVYPAHADTCTYISAPMCTHTHTMEDNMHK